MPKKKVIQNMEKLLSEEAAIPSLRPAEPIEIFDICAHPENVSDKKSKWRTIAEDAPGGIDDYDENFDEPPPPSPKHYDGSEAESSAMGFPSKFSKSSLTNRYGSNRQPSPYKAKAYRLSEGSQAGEVERPFVRSESSDLRAQAGEVGGPFVRTASSDLRAQIKLQLPVEQAPKGYFETPDAFPTDPVPKRGNRSKKITTPRVRRPYSPSAIADVPLDNQSEDAELVRKNLCIERMEERMLITAVAIDNDQRHNSIHIIPCEGEPLNYYPYDATQDAYVMMCRGFIDLGAIAVGYQMKVEGMESGAILALPEELIMKYLTPPQKKALKVFQEHNPESDCIIRFIQAVSC